MYVWLPDLTNSKTCTHKHGLAQCKTVNNGHPIGGYFTQQDCQGHGKSLYRVGHMRGIASVPLAGGMCVPCIHFVIRFPQSKRRGSSAEEQDTSGCAFGPGKSDVTELEKSNWRKSALKLLC